MMKLLSNLMSSRGRTRILLMKSEIFLTSLEMEDAQSMNLTNNAVVLRWRRRNSKELLKRLKLLLNKKKTRFFAHNWSLDKSDKRLIARSRRRKRNSTIHGN